MALEDWIDKVAAVFDLDDGKGGTLHSYRMDKFPDALSEYPCGIHFVQDVRFSETSVSGPIVDLYLGQTELHLTSDVNKAKLPYVMSFVRKVRVAMAATMSLGGSVAYFMPDPQRSIRVAPLKFGEEAPHLGLVVRWIVKENVSGEFTVSA